MAIEREIKLTADVDLVLPDLTHLLPGVVVGPVSTLRLDAVYYDTPSLALARWGVTLRTRSGEPGPIWTLKVAARDDGPGLSRHEYTFDEPLGSVPVGARMAARALTRSDTLGPVVHLLTERIQFTLQADGRPVLKVCDDLVTADGGPEPVQPFREVELEFVAERIDKPTLKAVRRVLRSAGCRHEEPIPKAVRALGASALDPPDVASVSITKHATTGELVRHVIGKSVNQLIDRHASVWSGDDPEDLHVFRVAGRRLRSDLRTFSSFLDAERTAWLRDELAWLGAEVGMGRDADVLAERLRTQMTQLPPEDAQSVDRLLQRLADNTAAARQHVIAALTSERYVALLDALVAAAGNPMFAADPQGLSDAPARSIVVDVAREPWLRLRHAAKALTPESPDVAFHAVRIKAKRARYAAETVVPVYGRDARRFAEALADLQSVLGDHQDTAVAEAWLRDAAKAVPSARVVIGELIAIERLERMRLRSRFTSVWKKASRRELRTWLD